MTVFNTNYTSIDEAFGFLNPELQQSVKSQKPKKKNKDPLCELYNQRWQQQPYTDTDLVSYANQYRYNKTNFQNQSVIGRESSPKYVDLSDGHSDGPSHASTNQETRQEYESNYDFQPSKFVEHEGNLDHKIKDEESYQTHSEQESQRPLPSVYDEDAMVKMLAKKYMGDYHNDKSNSLNYIDLVLYIISGIMLIFMMEQFVKIGMYMQTSSL